FKPPETDEPDRELRAFPIPGAIAPDQELRRSRRGGAINRFQGPERQVEARVASVEHFLKRDRPRQAEIQAHLVAFRELAGDDRSLESVGRPGLEERELQGNARAPLEGSR